MPFYILYMNNKSTNIRAGTCCGCEQSIGQISASGRVRENEERKSKKLRMRLTMKLAV